MKFKVRPDDPMPIYAQIVRQMRMTVMSGELQIGERMPTVRQLAVDLCVNSNTVARAYAELLHAGLIESRQGVGTFVKGMPKQPTGDNRQARLRGIVRNALVEAGAIGIGPNDLIEEIEKFKNGDE